MNQKLTVNLPGHPWHGKVVDFVEWFSGFEDESISEFRIYASPMLKVKDIERKIDILPARAFRGQTVYDDGETKVTISS